MCSLASHKSESLAGVLLQQALYFELRIGGAGKRNPHVNDGLPLRAYSLEWGFHEHETCTSQNSVDQKEIVEPVRVYRRNPPPFHSNVLPAHFGATAAQGKRCTLEQGSSSKFDSAPHSYGVSLFHFGNNATGARA